MITNRIPFLIWIELLQAALANDPLNVGIGWTRLILGACTLRLFSIQA